MTQQFSNYGRQFSNYGRHFLKIVRKMARQQNLVREVRKIRVVKDCQDWEGFLVPNLKDRRPEVNRDFRF